MASDSIASNACRLFVVLAVVSAPSPSAGRAVDPTTPQWRLHELHYGVHLPQQRSLARTLTLAREALTAEDYVQAFELLDIVLEADEDAWLDGDSPRSVRDAVRQAIEELSPAGLRAYALHADSRAERELDAAARQAFDGPLLRVAIRRPLTPAARDAHWLLAQRCWDDARFASAEILLRRSAPEDSKSMNGGDLRLQRLASRLARGGTVVGSKLPENAAVQWARRFAADLSARTPWQMPYGGPQGEPTGPALLVDQPRVTWDALYTSARSREGAIGLDRHITNSRPSPITSDGLVLWRTATNVVASDERTGRRLWETPGVEAAFPMRRRSVEQDLAGLGISTDGDRVYLIEPTTSAARSDPVSDARRLWGGRKSRVWRPEPNRLAAYSLSDQGKLAWTLDGVNAGRGLPDLALLGAPLCYEDRLFAVIDVDQTVLLVEIDPRTGALLWQQPLVGADRSPIDGASDVWAGITPVTADGIVVCPTRGGVVIGYDWVDGALRWAYRYPIDEDAEGRSDERDAEWRECRAVIQHDRVFACSPESSRLHCIELASGEPIWTAECPDARHLAVTPAAAVAIGPQVVIGMNLATGDRLWRRPLPSDAVLAGRPLASGDLVLVPMSGGRIASIDSITGDLEEVATFSETPAVLTAHRGDLLGAGRDFLIRYSASNKVVPFRSEELSLADQLQNATQAQAEGSAESAGELFRKLVQQDPEFAPARAAYLAWLMDESEHSRSSDDTDLIARLCDLRPADPELAVVAATHSVRTENRDGLAAASDDLARRLIPADRLVQVDVGRHVALGAAVSGALRRLAQNNAMVDGDRASQRFGHDFAASSRLLEADHWRWRSGRFDSADIDTKPSVAWGAHQVDVRVQPSRSGPLQTTGRGRDFSGLLRVESARVGPSDPRAPTQFELASTGSRLLGLSDGGEILFALDTSETNGDLQKAARDRSGAPWAWIAGRILVVAAGNDVAAYDLFARKSSQVRLWTAGDSIRQAMSRRGESDGPPKRWSCSLSGPAKVALITPEGAVVRTRQNAICFDLLTGAIRWEISIKADDQLWGAGSRLWLVRSDHTATRLSVVDGAPLAEARAPQMELFATTSDRIVGLSSQQGERRLIACDSADMRVTIEQSIPSPGARIWRANDQWIGVVAPEGWFQRINVRTGEADAQREFAPSLDSISQVRVLGRRALVFAPQRSALRGSEPIDSSESGTPFSGLVYALDAVSGEPLWSRPAELEGLSLLDRQGASDVLVFGARVTTADGRRMTRLVLLDAASGVQLYADNLAGSTPRDGYHIRYEPSRARSILAVELPGETLIARCLAAHRPPEPPPAVSVSLPTVSGEVDFWELGQELKRAIEQAAEDAQPPSEEK